MRKTSALCALLPCALILCVAIPAGAKEHVVRIISDYENLRMTFEPKTLHIEPGDTVNWVNQDDELHNMVTYPDGFPEGAHGFVSPYLVKKGETWSHKFTVEGTYEYHCVPHMFLGMRGSVIVARPSLPSEFHTPTEAEVQQYRKLIIEFHGDNEFQFVARAQRDGSRNKREK